jgi:hypothetical protein
MKLRERGGGLGGGWRLVDCRIVASQVLGMGVVLLETLAIGLSMAVRYRVSIPR